MAGFDGDEERERFDRQREEHDAQLARRDRMDDHTPAGELPDTVHYKGRAQDIVVDGADRLADDQLRGILAAAGCPLDSAERTTRMMRGFLPAATDFLGAHARDELRPGFFQMLPPTTWAKLGGDAYSPWANARAALAIARRHGWPGPWGVWGEFELWTLNVSADGRVSPYREPAVSGGGGAACPVRWPVHDEPAVQASAGRLAVKLVAARVPEELRTAVVRSYVKSADALGLHGLGEAYGQRRSKVVGTDEAKVTTGEARQGSNERLGDSGHRGGRVAAGGGVAAGGRRGGQVDGRVDGRDAGAGARGGGTAGPRRVRRVRRGGLVGTARRAWRRLGGRGWRR